MPNIDIKNNTIEIIEKLIHLSYSQTFEILPLERELTNLHLNSPQNIEPLIGMMFCAIMQGNKENALNYGNKIWNINSAIEDNLEMLYVDCLINIREFEKAKTLISARMNDIKKNLNIFYNALAKYSLFSGNLYILNNLAKYPEIYITDISLFDFAKKYHTGIYNKHYCAILKIINDTIGPLICATEYLIDDNENIQLYLYTSANTEENIKNKNIILEKINGYYISMQESPQQDIFINVENIKLHQAWW